MGQPYVLPNFFPPSEQDRKQGKEVWSTYQSSARSTKISRPRANKKSDFNAANCTSICYTSNVNAPDPQSFTVCVSTPQNTPQNSYTSLVPVPLSQTINVEFQQAEAPVASPPSLPSAPLQASTSTADGSTPNLNLMYGGTGSFCNQMVNMSPGNVTLHMALASAVMESKLEEQKKWMEKKTLK